MSATYVRRFRLDLECGHASYLNSVSGTFPASPPQHTDSLMCTTCLEFSPVQRVTEVPAVEPRLDCTTCRAEGMVIYLNNADTDHPTVTYECPNRHSWSVQL